METETIGRQSPGRTPKPPVEAETIQLADAARRIGIDLRWLKLRVQNGLIPGFRLDRKADWRITMQTFQDILDGKYNESPALSDLDQAEAE